VRYLFRNRRGALVFAMATTMAPLAMATDSVVPCTTLLTPRACYERYLQSVQQADRLGELYPFLTDDRVQTLERALAGAKNAGVDPAQVEQMTLDLLKRGASSPDRIRERRYEREASLVVDRPGITVEVRLVIENGSWRIADERFREAPRF
jgi:hypothetical protein